MMQDRKSGIGQKFKRVTGYSLSLSLVGFLIVGCASLKRILNFENEVRGGNAVLHSSKIVPGETTKNEIFTYFGVPEIIQEEENAFIYIWEEYVSTSAALSKVIGPEWWREAHEDEPDKEWVFRMCFILFDQKDIVTNYCHGREDEVLIYSQIFNILKACIAKKGDS
jgi:hypothetical protein